MPSIMALMPERISAYHYIEPFVGGGAVLFHLQPQKAVINDFNAELINVYEVIRQDPDALIEDLKRHKNNPDYFYRLRGLDRKATFRKLTSVQKASRVIYLNKTCFNGLYRVNNAGAFNAPFGRYKNPNIVNEAGIRAVHAYLQDNDIRITTGDYAPVLLQAPGNAFVYLDPPYHPVSESASFTGYVKGGWGPEDQQRLKEACDDLNRRGIKFLLSNSGTSFIKALYRDYAIHTVQANRAINSVGSKRGRVEEVLIRNYDIV